MAMASVLGLTAAEALNLNSNNIVLKNMIPTSGFEKTHVLEKKNNIKKIRDRERLAVCVI
jgi:hypothetical protein